MVRNWPTFRCRVTSYHLGYIHPHRKWYVVRQTVPCTGWMLSDLSTGRSLSLLGVPQLPAISLSVARTAEGGRKLLNLFWAAKFPAPIVASP